ncbi:Cysteine-rich secretory protein family protein [Streptoalloteichus hindustanus]|uniref:Cysteine-rich secretory protein family protein n=1 Tax=Streptoalloteichus hindustanus TaxID=2017 RepID=A0A1M5GWQ8_STRHI|nr:Cysteine-rich secretory protein family protein [Streptoalloteichus hindustanus]
MSAVADLVISERRGRHSVGTAERGHFSHTSPECATFTDRSRAAGYPTPGGETIARGQRSAEQVMEPWMNSPGRRATTRNRELTTTGTGPDARARHRARGFGR